MKSAKKPNVADNRPNSSLKKPNSPAFLMFVGGLVLFFTVAIFVGFSLFNAELNSLLFGRRTPKLAEFKEFVFREPKLNPATAPGVAPEGMVWIPGGEFYMGLDPETFPGHPRHVKGAQEIHLVYVDGFWMDKHELTNEQFAKFVQTTRYITDAEKQPDPKEFPNASPEQLKDLKPFSIVFSKPTPGTQIEAEDWWKIQHGANWQHPEGPGSTLAGRERHPVVHVSYNDALAYCKWAKKRLPTEAEWEFAARGGLNRNLYPWGDELKPNGKWAANVWQGDFPFENSKEDGFEGTAPVGSFPPNAYGLHDVAGNVWEWCADWYREDYYEDSADPDPLKAVRNPQGPISGFGWHERERGLPLRVQRGGSFACSNDYCMRYVVGTRGKGEVTSANVHIGFRCVMNAK